MKIAFIYNEVPNKEHSTDCYCAYLLLKMFSETAHQVEVVLLLTEHCNIGDAHARKRWLGELDRFNLCIHLFQDDTETQTNNDATRGFWQKIHQLAAPKIGDYFPQVSLSAKLNLFLETLKPDVIFV